MMDGGLLRIVWGTVRRWLWTRWPKMVILFIQRPMLWFWSINIIEQDPTLSGHHLLNTLAGLCNVSLQGSGLRSQWSEAGGQQVSFTPKIDIFEYAANVDCSLLFFHLNHILLWSHKHGIPFILFSSNLVTSRWTASGRSKNATSSGPAATNSTFTSFQGFPQTTHVWVQSQCKVNF